MIPRLAILALVLSAAWLLIWLWERRTTATPALRPGITVVTGPQCALCEPVVRAIRRADPEADLRVVDVAQMEDASIRSLPTVFVVDEVGELRLRRSGRAALDDAVVIAETGRDRGPHERASNTA